MVKKMYWVTCSKFKSYKDSQSFIAWFRNEENMAKYKAALTEGMKLVEIYFPILETADHDVETWFEIDNWAVMDKDRVNNKMKSLITELVQEIGIDIFEWSKSKALRTLHDVQFVFDA